MLQDWQHETLIVKSNETRLHSSGMRAAHLLTISQHALGRGCVSQHALCSWVYPSMHWVGCIPECTGHGGCLPEGVCPGGMSAQGSVCLGGFCLGDFCPGGVCLGGVCPGAVADTPGTRGRQPPPVNRMTDRCKNITLLQLRWGR